MRLLPALLLPALLLLPGCSETVDTAVKARDCAALAADVAALGLGGVPSLEQAERAVQRLDDRVAALDSPDVRDAATTLRDRLRDLEQAARSGSATQVRDAAAQAREAATAAAETCGLPVSQFLG